MPTILTTTGRTSTLAKLYHPLYGEWQATWIRAIDVYEGAGGFLDAEKPYLVPHPREWLDHTLKDSTSGAAIVNPNPTQPSPKLKTRRKMARYENLCEAILTTLVSSLFYESPTRTFANNRQDPWLMDWWQNVDGRGTSIDAFIRDAWIMAAVMGHMVTTLEKAETEPTNAADVQLPRLYPYTPLDVLDWLQDDTGAVTAVKLVEALPRTDFLQVARLTDYVIRTVDDTEWKTYNVSGRTVKPDDEATHNMGRLPVAFLYGRRRTLTPVIGKAIIGDPMLYIDLYNLTSEVRELLRNQTFGILNVPIGEKGSVLDEQKKIGETTGTANVLFSTMQASYISPDGTNVSVYHEHIDRLARMVYRVAAVPWESDSRDAESADSRRLKRADLESTLRGYAAELLRFETELTELVFRARFGPEQWQSQLERTGLTIAYPTRFEPPDLEAVAARAAELIGLDLGETATKEIKKRTVRVSLPDLDEQKQEASDKEIDGQTILTADEKQQQLLEQTAARLGALSPGQKMPAMDDEKMPPKMDDKQVM